ncbi:MAG: hypothetical protein ACRD68_10600, partial [Pyrinomonadaceae bacterium]
IELAVRAWRSGIKIFYVPSIVGVHNDWAGFTIRDYCQRQRTYTHCEPPFWQKYGDDYPKQELVRKNLPILWGQDSAADLLRKSLKRLSAARPVQWMLFSACDVLERVCPWPPALWRLYRMLLAGAMYRGFQEGMKIYGIDLDRVRRQEKGTGGQ